MLYGFTLEEAAENSLKERHEELYKAAEKNPLTILRKYAEGHTGKRNFYTQEVKKEDIEELYITLAEEFLYFQDIFQSQKHSQAEYQALKITLKHLYIKTCQAIPIINEYFLKEQYTYENLEKNMQHHLQEGTSWAFLTSMNKQLEKPLPEDTLINELIEQYQEYREDGCSIQVATREAVSNITQVVYDHE